MQHLFGIDHGHRCLHKVSRTRLTTIGPLRQPATRRDACRSSELSEEQGEERGVA